MRRFRNVGRAGCTRSLILRSSGKGETPKCWALGGDSLAEARDERGAHRRPAPGRTPRGPPARASAAEAGPRREALRTPSTTPQSTPRGSRPSTARATPSRRRPSPAAVASTVTMLRQVRVSRRDGAGTHRRRWRPRGAADAPAGAPPWRWRECASRLARASSRPGKHAAALRTHTSEKSPEGAVSRYQRAPGAPQSSRSEVNAEFRFCPRANASVDVAK